MSDSLILASYGIDVTDLEIYEILDESDREVSIRLRLRRTSISCPHCGCLSDIWFFFLIGTIRSFGQHLFFPAGIVNWHVMKQL